MKKLKFQIGRATVTVTYTVSGNTEKAKDTFNKELAKILRGK